MKYILLIVIFSFGLSETIFAQKEDLQAAQVNIDSKEYVAALDNISKAKRAITKVISDNLASVLPEKLGGFEMQEQDGSDEGMGSQGVSVTRVYKKPAAETEPTTEEEQIVDPMMAATMMDGGNEPQIKVTISSDMMMAGEVMNAHSMSENQMSQEGRKALRIKGFRAVVKTQQGGADAMMGGNQPSRETAQVIVGGAFVSIEAQGLEKLGNAEKMANQIDFLRLKEIIGE